MARNPAAQTAYGPMVLAAIEHHELPGQRLVDDDLATPFLPAFERDDVLTTLVEHAYRTAFRTFFVAEGVTQYLTERAVRSTLEGLLPAATGSRLVFTYVRRDFIDGTNLYGSPTLSRMMVKKLWHFGLQPDEVADFLAGYGWRLIEQAGPEQLLQRYVEPTGRNLTASDLEWSVYAEKE